MLPVAASAHQTHKQGGEVAKHLQLFAQFCIEELLEQGQAPLGNGESLRQAGQKLIAAGGA